MYFTLWGIYQVRNDLFDNIVLPDQCDKSTLIDLLMEECGGMYVYHQQPDYFKTNIGRWFSRKKPQFERIFKALEAKYNPVENYDRTEEWTDTPNVSYVKSGGHTESKGTKTVNEVDLTNGGTSDVAGYNTDAYSNSDRTNSTEQGNVKLTNSGEDTTTYNDETTKESGTRTHQGRMHGNIGVTTNQQMIQSEIELRQYDAYENIVSLFEKQFLIQVY